MTLTDEELEAAAVAAERWGGRNARTFDTWRDRLAGESSIEYERACGCPALQIQNMRHGTFEALPDLWDYVYELDQIFGGSILAAIDAGRKHEVAAAFRAAKKGEGK